MKAKLCISLIGAIAIAELALTPSVRGADTIAGTWEGTLDQPGYGPYKVRVTLTSATTGTTEYPTLNCTGVLSGGGKDGRYRYTERLTSGSIASGGQNVDGGTVIIVQQGDAALFEWSGTDRGIKLIASGKIYRAKATPAAATCQEAEKALIADVSAGLAQSKGLRTYVAGARQKYSNSIKNIQGGCQDTRGYRFFKNLGLSLEREKNEAGLKSAVETELRGVLLSK